MLIPLDRKICTENVRTPNQRSHGNMVEGVAHDFRNYMHIIAAAANLMEKSAQDTRTVKGCEIIIDVCHKASELVTDMISLSKGGKDQQREININDEVEKCTSLLAAILPRHVQLERDFDESLPVVSAKVSQIHRILINLVNNAAEAMNQQGRIRITTGKTLVTERDCRLHPDARPGEFVILTVSDTGPGISPHLIGRIFDPFFSTKEDGDNAGLGLTTVRKILRGHRGWIDVESEVGQGTTFKLFFPAVSAGGDVPHAPS